MSIKTIYRSSPVIEAQVQPYACPTWRNSIPDHARSSLSGCWLYIPRRQVGTSSSTVSVADENAIRTYVQSSIMTTRIDSHEWPETVFLFPLLHPRSFFHRVGKRSFNGRRSIFLWWIARVWKRKKNDLARLREGGNEQKERKKRKRRKERKEERKCETIKLRRGESLDERLGSFFADCR